MGPCIEACVVPESDKHGKRPASQELACQTEYTPVFRGVARRSGFQYQPILSHFESPRANTASQSQDVEEAGAFLGTLQGRRPQNQDRVALACYYDPCAKLTTFLAIVADGMGGMQHGSEAAAIAVATILDFCHSSAEKLCAQHLIEEATQAANHEVYTRFHGTGGAAIVLLLWSAEAAFIAHVGDCRAYGVSEQRRVSRLTSDHTLNAQVAAYYEKQSEDVTVSPHPKGDSLLQFVGMRGRPSIDLERLSPDINLVILTSDGVHGPLDTSLIQFVVRNSSSTKLIGERLLQMAEYTGPNDNASVLCVQPRAAKAHAENLILQVWVPWSEFSIVPIPAAELRRVPQHFQALDAPAAEPAEFSNQQNETRNGIKQFAAQLEARLNEYERNNRKATVTLSDGWKAVDREMEKLFEALATVPQKQSERMRETVSQLLARRDQSAQALDRLIAQIGRNELDARNALAKLVGKSGRLRQSTSTDALHEFATRTEAAQADLRSTILAFLETASSEQKAMRKQLEETLKSMRRDVERTGTRFSTAPMPLFNGEKADSSDSKRSAVEPSAGER